MSSMTRGWGMWGMTTLWPSSQSWGLGVVGEVVIIVVRQHRAGGHGGQCWGWGDMGGRGGMSSPSSGNAGAGDMSGHVILVVMAVHHCWMMLGAG